LQALLVKLFADRQLAVEPAVIAYMIRHMDRSTEAALRLVDDIDRQSMITHRKVTRASAATALARTQTSDD
jgi:chromosomal replication initiation ATPase DnaA